MNRKVFALLSVGLVAALMGCEPSSSKKSKSSGTNSSSIGKMEHDDHGHEAGHGHGAGPNGGTLADWGGGKFHVEFTVDHDKKETVVYILGSDEKTLQVNQTQWCVAGD